MTVEYENKRITRNRRQLFIKKIFYFWIHDIKTTKVIYIRLLFVILCIIYQSMIFLTWGAFLIYCYIIHSTNSEWYDYDVEVQGYPGLCQRWTHNTNLFRATSRGRIIFNSVSINTLRRWAPSQSERTRCYFGNN